MKISDYDHDHHVKNTIRVPIYSLGQFFYMHTWLLPNLYGCSAPFIAIRALRALMIFVSFLSPFTPLSLLSLLSHSFFSPFSPFTLLSLSFLSPLSFLKSPRYLSRKIK